MGGVVYRQDERLSSNMKAPESIILRCRLLADRNGVYIEV